jgi:predicted dehydrogenase
MAASGLKFVIVGTGNISNTYVQAISKIPDCEITGIISRSGKAPSSLENADSVIIADSLKNMHAAYDAVILCTPNSYHHTGAIEAAALGKHVLVEKPLDINLINCNTMIAACHKANVKLGVAYQRRLSGDNPLIKKLIEDNVLGRIFAVDLSVKYYRDENYYKSSPYRGTRSIDGGGPFMQQASHYIDLYGWLFGKPDKIISSLHTYVHHIESEDHGTALCFHKNMTGTITTSTATKPGFPAELEIHSDKGTVILENDVITFWAIDGVDNPSPREHTNKHTGAATPLVNDTTNHEMIIKDFVNAVHENREPMVSGADARLATEIILEIYKNNIE